MCKKGYHCTLLVGMQIGADSMENSMEVPPKLKMELTYDPAISLLCKYLTIKKNEMLPFATAWMDPEGIMLSEINQQEKDKYCMISLIVRI